MSVANSKKPGVKMYKILIVDNDANHLLASKLLLESRGYEVETANTGSEAIKKVQEAPSSFGIVLLDLNMPEKDGLETAREILSISRSLYVLIHSGAETQEAVINSFEAGAVGFIQKATNSIQFLEKIAEWCRKYEETLLTVTESPDSKYKKEISEIGLIGASKKLAEIVHLVKKYAPLKNNILILGETGTGKERISHALHLGPKQSLFPINCAAFNGNQDLMESELFGHMKGAFTGADSIKMGVFRKAEGGTVVLDEIDTLPLSAQQKLLRVLRERKVRPLGCEQEFEVDFRLIATAKPDLEQRTLSGKFMPDLFERLNGLVIDIPPLRERTDDIAPLVIYFCNRYEKRTGLRKTLLAKTMKYLEAYNWPRNVAQLENTIERLCVNTDGEVIKPKHLDGDFFKKTYGISLNEHIESVVKEEIEDAAKISFSRRDLSRRLGIPESTLRRKLKEYNIPDPFNSQSEQVRGAR